jgi:limonene-1,2-epoxide hydrolase
MTEESTTPDLAERVQGYADAINARDFDGAASFWAPDAVYTARSPVSALEGRVAIRGFLEEWFGAYEVFELEVDELRDLGHGVMFGAISQRGRLPGTTGWVEDRFTIVSVWVDDLIQQATSYADIDDARAAAERLAQERG